MTADAPIAAGDFGNLDPGNAAHGLAFDRTIASVSLLIIWRFCSALNTFSMT